MIDWDEAVLAPCMAVFGEDLKPLYQHAAGGAAFAIDGIFDDGYRALVMAADGDPEIATVDPVLGVRQAQFSQPIVKGDRVTLPRVGKAYVVGDVQPDGKGLVKLLLNRA